jgi:hypothetical protein
MKYLLPLEVFLPNGLSGRHPPSGGHPSRARGGGGGWGGGLAPEILPLQSPGKGAEVRDLPPR